MGLDGGGGGGGALSVGNPFTGAASTLEFIGKTTWAGWSGLQTTTNGSPTTVFDFTSPAQSIKTIIDWGFDRTDTGNNSLVSLEVKFNGSTVFFTKAYSHNSDGGYSNTTEFHLVIPTRTQVEIIIGTNDTDDIPMTVVITGEEI